MTPLERWLYERFRLRLSWQGQIAKDSVLLMAIVAGCYLTWVVLVALAS